ncbi:hypothetical protein CK203_014971 [Vitis vinifera]|uniref:Reverse transcriptase zinc-binding domain-containing protein n=1 Tax=Vitis vinifera TaxID=29760 RepID=A0A438JCV1_VITVI|nr:hypothetical protein CK203_014971 [Vitis vinifera]
MRGCLSSISYAILVNGNAKGRVKASRGLRQGDPLSPFLFTIVADVLSRMMLKAKERSVLEGFKVNLDKSNLFGINLDQNHLSRLALLLECKTFDWPILYLGLPLGENPIAYGFWDPVIERISRRLDGWQKLTYLSVIPASVAAKIERLQRDFLWSGLGKVKEIILLVGIRCESRGLFTIKSFFIALSQMSNLSPLFPTKFVWNSQVPFKVKAFVWLVAHKKANTNDLLQLRRPTKLLVLTFLAKLDWVPLRSISKILANPREGWFCGRIRA